MMNNNIPSPEALKQRNREEAMRLAKPWEDYSEKYNRLSRAMRKANIDIELLADLVSATILLYRS